VQPEEVDQLEGWSVGSVEEALHYCVNELSCWNDAEGGREWISSWWVEQSEELETWGDADDDKYSELLLQVLSANNAHPEWLRADDDDEEDEDEVSSCCLRVCCCCCGWCETSMLLPVSAS